jgi:hypothetical protein
MSDDETAETRVPDDRPPAWANALMKWALTTPGLQNMIGQGVALLSFEGRRTAKTYTIPVSYNFESPIEVELRLAGRDYSGKAQIMDSAGEALEFMTEYLKERPIDAKAYGLAKEDVTREKISKIIPKIVVIRIDVDHQG